MDYIKENGLSVDQITKDTGIEKERFCSENIKFTADEFLTLCEYLHEDPYHFCEEENA